MKKNMENKFMSINIFLLVIFYTNNFLLAEIADDGSYACIRGGKKAVVELRIHAQKAVADALFSLYSSKDYENVNEFDALDHIEALRIFVENSIEDVNNEIHGYGIEIHPDLNQPIIESFMSNMNFDSSCELGNANLERTSEAYAELTSKYTFSVGFHIFIWVCPYLPTNIKMIQRLDKEKCGRVMGIIWNGSEDTAHLISSAIKKAFLLVDSDTVSPDSMQTMDICGYISSCVGTNPSDLGQVVIENEMGY